jgi:cell division protein FtsX
MRRDASPAQIGAVATALRGNPEVVTNTYLDHEDAASEFSSLFGSSGLPGAGPVAPADLPTSYHVALKPGADRDGIRPRYKALPGVQEVIVP